MGTAIGTDTLARKQIETFGRVLSQDILPGGGQRDDSHLLETWKITDESMLGAVMLREDAAGLRLGLKQIMAVQSAHADVLILGAISWLQVTRAGQLSAGVNYFPGVPQTLTIKSMGGKSTAPDQSVDALLLPAVTALKIPSSLIIPRDWFFPGRVIELSNRDNQKLKAKMELSIESGLDSERISFTPV